MTHLLFLLRDDGVREGLLLHLRAVSAGISERAPAEGLEELLLHGSLNLAGGVVVRALLRVGEDVVGALNSLKLDGVAALVGMLLSGWALAVSRARRGERAFSGEKANDRPSASETPGRRVSLDGYPRTLVMRLR